MSVLTLSYNDYTVIYIHCLFTVKFKLNMSTQQITYIQTPTHNPRSMEQKPYNIMKISITVISVPESMKISIKRPTFAYRVTSE